MKYTINLLMVALLGSLLIAGCHKVDDLPYYSEGKAVVLTASKTSVSPAPADSATNMIDFSWTKKRAAISLILTRLR